uniref:uncharacterized protein LOC120889499 n=1 Tax=Ictidomys tridecemlineatus TaxID=43179 RepID=UPI001A9E4BF6|nr:uncharacterized protein LOC120889499 [Ictidomys tridecemlineatus]
MALYGTKQASSVGNKSHLLMEMFAKTHCKEDRFPEVAPVQGKHSFPELSRDSDPRTRSAARIQDARRDSRTRSGPSQARLPLPRRLRHPAGTLAPGARPSASRCPHTHRFRGARWEPLAEAKGTAADPRRPGSDAGCRKPARRRRGLCMPPNPRAGCRRPHLPTCARLTCHRVLAAFAGAHCSLWKGADGRGWIAGCCTVRNPKPEAPGSSTALWKVSSQWEFILPRLNCRNELLLESKLLAIGLFLLLLIYQASPFFLCADSTPEERYFVFPSTGSTLEVCGVFHSVAARISLRHGTCRQKKQSDAARRWR